MSQIKTDALQSYLLAGDIDREEVAMTLVDYGYDEEDVDTAIDELFEEGLLEGDDRTGSVADKALRYLHVHG